MNKGNLLTYSLTNSARCVKVPNRSLCFYAGKAGRNVGGKVEYEERRDRKVAVTTACLIRLKNKSS